MDAVELHRILVYQGYEGTFDDDDLADILKIVPESVRRRSQVLLKQAGPESMLILAVHGLAVHGALPAIECLKVS